MHIGLTYDLRPEYLAFGYSEEETAEFDSPETIAAIDEALRQLGHGTDRIGNARQLVERLARGDRWDLVLNICEGLEGIGREAQVPTLLDLYGLPYTFADPLGMIICLHKGLAKGVISQAGLPTPRYVVVERMEDLGVLPFHFPVFVKPVAEGTGKGVTPASRVTDTAALADVCQRLLARFHQGVLVEEDLPGRELTVGLLGTGADAEVLGTLEVVLLDGAEAGVYSYWNKEHCEELVEYRLAPTTDPVVRRAEEIALAAWRVVGGRDGGRIDLKCDAHGHPQFLEANPLAGLHPEHSDLPILATALGVTYVELISRILASASRRLDRGSNGSRASMRRGPALMGNTCIP